MEGPAWRHGRAWFGRRGHDGGAEVRIEWVCWPSDYVKIGGYLRIDRGDDTPLGVGIFLGMVRFYIGFRPARGRLRWLYRVPPGEFEMVFSTMGAWSIHASVWARPMEWRSADPWWRKTKVIHIREVILGRAQFSERVIEERDVFVPMPEGCYVGTAALAECEWHRRFGWVDRRLGVTVRVPDGIPHDGKGENSWDCGEDRTYSISSGSRTIEEAIGNYVGSVLRSRHRYGGHREPVTMAPRPPKPEAV